MAKIIKTVTEEIKISVRRDISPAERIEISMVTTNGERKPFLLHIVKEDLTDDRLHRAPLKLCRYISDETAVLIALREAIDEFLEALGTEGAK